MNDWSEGLNQAHHPKPFEITNTPPLNLLILSASKILRQSRVLQRLVRRVARFGAVIHREVLLADRAEPDFIVAATLSDLVAARPQQQVDQLLIESRQSSGSARGGHARGAFSHEMHG